MSADRGEILFLSHRIPWPPDRGDKIRSHHELRALAALAPVHVGCFADDARDESFGPDMAEITASQCIMRRPGRKPVAALRGLARHAPLSVALFESAAMQDYVRRTLRDRPIRAVFGFSSQIAQYVHDLPAGCRFVMDFVDIDSAKFASYGVAKGGPMGWVHRREGRVLGAYEGQIARQADRSLFVSDAEAGLFRELHGFSPDRVIALENGVALDYFSSVATMIPLLPGERGSGPLIVFTGQMDYRPNIEAVIDFAQRSLPAIRNVYKDARFAIVGRNPVAQVRSLCGEAGVVMTGAVDDVRPWLAAADVVVAPLRIARGIQNKILEAMAMARPVIASTQAAEGIDAVEGRDLLVARDPDAEAGLVLDLLADPTRAAAIGRAARARVEARYSWAAAMAPLEELLFGRSSRTVAAPIEAA
ncbi:TIGR03087 family PEP-CTERM/XrtA system glycosyltransferase [Sphingobium nicotianae]|uniref:TIGR03087 family PEP-CTERM/XrtA system glycosyltransferase n=1 Tax=Sphingobium nicotianae TaxID=2782607 RepID=A0A9X1DBM0_9SPHN|nr:TIGR03087 family PEP-CTERM/XrtA system glycosyltransferase [Sphingobium nicotianae]MBT2186939.1 TIGR03087 family PEP-CTERM/XrtA system glycosyltransferase [Sphingobium nicotianae]